MRKIFDPNGDITLRFAKDAQTQIQRWLGEWHFEDAVKHATECQDAVFGEALVFPCIAIDGELPTKPISEDTIIANSFSIRELANRQIRKQIKDTYGDDTATNTLEGDYGAWCEWEDVLTEFAVFILKNQKR